MLVLGIILQTKPALRSTIPSAACASFVPINGEFTPNNGGVVPDHSRDHTRRVVPLTGRCFEGSRRRLCLILTRCLYASVRWRRIAGRFRPPMPGICHRRCYPVHHLEGHLLSPLLADDKPGVSICRFAGVGRTIRTGGRTRYRR